MVSSYAAVQGYRSARLAAATSSATGTAPTTPSDSTLSYSSYNRASDDSTRALRNAIPVPVLTVKNRVVDGRGRADNPHNNHRHGRLG
jgi:hypothetical protein